MREKPKKRKWLRRLGIATGVLAAAIAGILASGWSAFGKKAAAARLDRMKASAHFEEGHFVDVMPRREPAILKASWKWITGGSDFRTPADPIPVVQRKAADFAEPPATGLRVTWLGHSTLLVEIDGKRVLVDPVWGPRASPFSWVGPKRFFAPPLALDDLPPLDAVIISHDHYDHLDMFTVKALIAKNVPFVVPLGVGSHLEYWGMPADRITELDWWGEHTIGDLKFTATPARHFSGRFLHDKDHTLWAGWALHGPQHRVYYSGDTAFFPGMAEIGERLGPFDLTMIESGAYDELWADVHIGPEQAVAAHRLVGGKVLLPVHWGLFDLALHGWTEPIERILKAATPHGIQVATPRPGESVEPAAGLSTERWWPDVPFDTVEKHIIRASGTESIDLEQIYRTGHLPRPAL